MIKHFKLIHFILLVLSGIVVWQLRDILQFFNTFIANGYTATITDNMASNYIGITIYLVLFLMFILLTLLIVLLKFKKKPEKIYRLALIYYIILFVAVIISGTLLNALEEQLWSTTQARMYRDIATIISLPSYFFVPFWLMRALGFNVKQFNFQSDLQELNITDIDSEEIEINLGFETYKTKRKIHRLFREFKYYFFENKLIMIIIFSVTCIALLYVFISNFEIYTKRYKIGQTFKFNDLDITIDDSIITNLNYAGNVINNVDYFYLLKLTVENNTRKDITFEYNKFLIYSNKKTYYVPNLGLSSDFVDYAEVFSGLDLTPGTKKTIFLPYAINKNRIKDKFYLNIYNGSSKKKKEFRAKTIEIDLNPIIIDTIDFVGESKLDEKLSFNSTYLNDTTLTITDALVTPSYVYDYEVCNFLGCNMYKGKVTPNVETRSQTLLVLGYELSLDPTAPYTKVSNRASTFATNFFKVRFATNDTIYTETVKNVTPNNLKDKIVLQLPKEAEEARQMELLVTIRNKSYIIKVIG